MLTGLALLATAGAATNPSGDSGGNSYCSVEPPQPILRETAVKKGTYRYRVDPPAPDTAPSASEEARLLSGVPVTIEMGGCVHWAEVYRFRVADVGTVNCRGWLKTAQSLLQETARSAVHPEPIANYVRAIQEALESGKAIVCGLPVPLDKTLPDYGEVTVSTAALQNGAAQVEISVSIVP